MGKVKDEGQECTRHSNRTLVSKLKLGMGTFLECDRLEHDEK